MSTIEEKLKLLLKTKTDIRNALKAKGVEISPDTPFSEYDVAIKAIQAGDLLLVKDMQELLDKGEVTEETKALIYNEETDIFEGIYIYTNKTWQLMPTQLTAKAENIAPGYKAYGPDGVVEGSFTSDADATSPDIMNGKIAYVNGQKVIGNYIPLDTSDATVTANDIINPKTAYKDGKKITGNIIPTYGISTPALIPNKIFRSTSYTIQDISYKNNLALINNGSTAFKIAKINSSYRVDYDNATNFTFSDIGLGSSYTLNQMRFALVNNSENEIYIFFNMSQSGSTTAKRICRVTYHIDTNTITNAIYSNYTIDHGYDYVPNMNMYVRPCYPKDVVVIAGREVGLTGNMFIKAWTSSDTSFTSKLETSLNSNSPNNFAGGVAYGYWTDDGQYFNATGHSGAYSINYNTGAYMLYHVNSSSTWTSKKSLANTANTNFYRLLNNGYAIKGSSLYKCTALDTAIGTVSSSSLSYSRAITILGDYIFIANGTSTSVYKLNVLTSKVTSLTSFSTYSSSIISQQGIVYLYDDTDNNFNGYTVGEDKTIDSFERSGQNYYNVSKATATAENILSGKAAYGTSGLLVGTMKNNGTLNYYPSESEQTIPAGYTSGGTVHVMDFTISKEYNECLNVAKTILGEV